MIGNNKKQVKSKVEITQFGHILASFFDYFPQNLCGQNYSDNLA